MTIYISPELLYRWIVNALALLVVAFLLSGVIVRGPIPLILAAIVLGLVNAWVRPLVLFLTLPINIVSLGLFTFVVNGLMLLITSALVPGFVVKGFFTAIWAALWLTIVSAIISMVIKKR